jgi:glycosyltransferase involved in cell wall biosynthesis
VLHVGLNLLYLVPGEVGGSEIYARRLVDALARARPGARFTAFCGVEAAASLRAEGWPGNVRVQALPVRARAKPARIAAEIALLPGAAARARVDLLHSLGTTCPPVAGRPSVVTILDLIYEAYPETFPRASLLGLRALVGPAARRADRVIAISHAVKRDVVARLRVPAERVDVVHLGLGMRADRHATPEGELRSRLGLGAGRIVLCVSAALAHKNLPRLIGALGRLGAGFEDCRLVVVGHPGLERQRLEARAAQAGLTGRVTFTGWISSSDLEGLYGAATCAVYPSLHEGFGMPVLEAMARGVPLACSDATSLPEVAGDAALLFDARDEAAIAAATRRLLNDPELAADLRARGRERAAAFTWERCAEGVLDVYARVAAARRPLRPGG